MPIDIESNSLQDQKFISTKGTQQISPLVISKLFGMIKKIIDSLKNNYDKLDAFYSGEIKEKDEIINTLQDKYSDYLFLEPNILKKISEESMRSGSRYR